MTFFKFSLLFLAFWSHVTIFEIATAIFKIFKLTWTFFRLYTTIMYSKKKKQKIKVMGLIRGNSRNSLTMTSMQIDVTLTILPYYCHVTVDRLHFESYRLKLQTGKGACRARVPVFWPSISNKRNTVAPLLHRPRTKSSLYPSPPGVHYKTTHRDRVILMPLCHANHPGSVQKGNICPVDVTWRRPRSSQATPWRHQLCKKTVSRLCCVRWRHGLRTFPVAGFVVQGEPTDVMLSCRLLFTCGTSLILFDNKNRLDVHSYPVLPSQNI